MIAVGSRVNLPIGIPFHKYSTITIPIKNADMISMRAIVDRLDRYSSRGEVEIFILYIPF